MFMKENQGRKTIIVLIGIILILVGTIIGYLVTQYMESSPYDRNFTFPTKQAAQEEPLTPARDTSIVKAVKKAGPAVVGITTRIYDRDIFNQNVLVSEGVGSGVILNTDGYIVTNNHVVAGAGEGKVTVSLSDGTSVEGKVIGTDPLTDLAVVKIDGNEKLPAIELGDSDTLQVGEPAIAIGNPLGLEFRGTVTTGVISALHRTVNMETQRFPLIQTDAPINPGNSGGALVNADGQLVGINSEKIAHAGIEGLGFAIPINEAKPIIESLIKYGYVERPYLGIYALDKQTAAHYGYQLEGEGLLIVKIDANGPLGQVGVRRGDYLVAVDGKAVTTLLSLKQIIDTHKPNETIRITYARNGKTTEAEVTLGKMTSGE